MKKRGTGTWSLSRSPGHIACDAASKSEIVSPIVIQNRMYGVLDIDSPLTKRFDETDENELKKSVRMIAHHLQNII